MTIEKMECEFYTTHDVARLLGVSTRTMAKLRKMNEGPPYLKIGPKLIKYSKNGFHQWKKKLDELR